MFKQELGVIMRVLSQQKCIMRELGIAGRVSNAAKIEHVKPPQPAPEPPDSGSYHPREKPSDSGIPKNETVRKRRRSGKTVGPPGISGKGQADVWAESSTQDMRTNTSRNASEGYRGDRFAHRGSNGSSMELVRYSGPRDEAASTQFNDDDDTMTQRQMILHPESAKIDQARQDSRPRSKGFWRSADIHGPIDDGALDDAGVFMSKRALMANSGPHPTDGRGYRDFLAVECYNFVSHRIRRFEEIQRGAADLQRWNIQQIDTNKDRHDAAIYTFTLVTIIFLPISTVASVLGMNTNDVRNMDQSQWVFWAVSIPLTITVLTICIIWTGEVKSFGRSLRNLARNMPRWSKVFVDHLILALRAYITNLFNHKLDVEEEMERRLERAGFPRNQIDGILSPSYELNTSGTRVQGKPVRVLPHKHERAVQKEMRKRLARVGFVQDQIDWVIGPSHIDPPEYFQRPPPPGQYLQRAPPFPGGY
jgi:hypothetical protein